MDCSVDSDELLLAAQLLEGGPWATTPHSGMAPPPMVLYGGQPPAYQLPPGLGPPPLAPHMGAPPAYQLPPVLGPPPGFGAGSPGLMPHHHQLPPQAYHHLHQPPPWVVPPPHKQQQPHMQQQPPLLPAVVHPSWANVMRQRQQEEEQHQLASGPQWPALAPIRTRVRGQEPGAATGLNPAAPLFVPLHHQQQQQQQQQQRQQQQQQQQQRQQQQQQQQQQRQHQPQKQKHHHKQQKQKLPPFVVKREVAAALISQQRNAPAPRLSPHSYFARHCSLVNPFWVSAVSSLPNGTLAVAHLPPLSQHAAAAMAADGVARVASCLLSLDLPLSHVRLLQAAAAQLQLLCLLVDDAVPHRGHWPPNASVTVNGTRVRPYTAKRASDNVMLKPQQIDLPLDITRHALAAADRVSRTSSIGLEVQLRGASSGRGFVLGCMLVQDAGIKGVKGRMAPAVSLRKAVARVQQRLSGGGDGDEEDDDDVVMAATVLSLRCPLSGVRLTTPAHFSRSTGLACFDLDAFLQMTQRSGKWQCPLSMALAPLEQLQEEPFLATVMSALSAAGLDDSVDEVEVGPDARWRPKGVSSCWFDVLQPCSTQELRAALQGGGSRQLPGVGGKRGRGGESDGGTDPSSSSGGGGGGEQQQQAKRRRTEAVDLTLGSSSSDDEADEEADEPLAQRAVRVVDARENEPLAQGAARVAAARRGGGGAAAPPPPARVAPPPAAGGGGGGLRLCIRLPGHAARPAVQRQPAGAGHAARLQAVQPLPAVATAMSRREELQQIRHFVRVRPPPPPPAAAPAGAEVIELLDSDDSE